ncbi:MAG TPA: iron ABC transporter permease, partial [Vineibacter sp.]|nr:iron ABC transporter permease [Vineibacter sp.]
MPGLTAGAAGYAPAYRSVDAVRDRWLTRAGMGLLLVVVAILFVWPVSMLLIGMFRSGPPGMPGAWTVDTVIRVLTEEATYVALANSLVYAVFCTAVATALGAFFAFLATRSTVPLAGWLTPAMLLVFATPHVLYAVSWGLVADTGNGMLNLAARFVLGPQSTPFNAYTWTGLLTVHTLKLTAFCYLLLLPPFQSMNRSYEEASLIAGAGRFATLLRINLPLLTPAIFGVVILGCVFGLGAFDLPQILGGLAGISVISTEVYKALNFATPPDYAAASSLGLFMMIALVLLLALQWKLFGRNQFVTVTGKGYRSERWDLGRWGYACSLAIVAYVVVTLILPGAQLVLTSFQTTLGVNTFTVDNYRAVFADPLTAQAFRVTGYLALLGGLIAVLLAAVVAYAGRHSPRWLEVLLDSVAVLPIIMPGVVLAVGLLLAYVSVPGLRLLYGTFWLALIGIVVFVTPIASRIVRGGIVQISGDLEEAASVSGASRTRVLVDIVARLLGRSLLVGWLVTAIIAAGTLDFPLLLLPPTTPNVSVLAYSYMNSGYPSQASALLVLLV